MRRQLNLQLITFKTQSLGQMSGEKSRTLELCGQHHEGHGPKRGKDGRQLVNQEVAICDSFSCYQNRPQLQLAKKITKR